MVLQKITFKASYYMKLIYYEIDLVIKVKQIKNYIHYPFKHGPKN